MANVVTLFSYGSIILPNFTSKEFGCTFQPYKSVFMRGYKLSLQHANSKTYPKYHYIRAEATENEADLLPGFLVSVPEALIRHMDAFEGSSYKRVNVECFDRELNAIPCQMYVAV